MEDITTELKLKIAELENINKDFEARCIELLREKDIEIASLKVEVANCKNKIMRTRVEIKGLYESKRISPEEYANALEVLSD